MVLHTLETYIHRAVPEIYQQKLNQLLNLVVASVNILDSLIV